jgi:TRAP-type C4-dicarboxylate transport system permease small subunit
MSTQASVTIPGAVKVDREKMHRARLTAGYALAIALVAALSVYGFDYYRLDAARRPFSPKHDLLKPNGEIGLWLGVLGTMMFLIIFLYALRKRWPWLKRKGVSRHWLDFHVVLGLSAPFVIAFHASFKFGGIAGMAFWIMTAVAISGVVGRYLYAQIPRSLNAAELSLKEARDLQAESTEQLTAQSVVSPEALAPLFRLPSAEVVATEPMILVLASLLVVDLQRQFRIARLRLHYVNRWGMVTSLGGFLPSERPELEQVIEVARRQAALSKRVLFLSRSQQVFHLWHVIHRPFSYSFAVLALLHIGVVLLFGVR